MFAVDVAYFRGIPKGLRERRRGRRDGESAFPRAIVSVFVSCKDKRRSIGI